MNTNFLPHERQEMLSIARNAITNHLKGLPPPKPQAHYPRAAFEHYPTFICFFDKNKNVLTGYGNPFSNNQLFDSIVENTVKAALQNSENAIDSIEKLENALIAISIISTPTRISHWQDIKLHEQGVIIHYDNKHSFALPQGAKHFNWDLSSMMEELCRRANIPKEVLYGNLCEIDVFTTENFNEVYQRD